MDWRQWRIWDFVADMNGDGRVTISDVWLWFKWLYFYPGDGLIYLMGNTKLGNFLELSANSYGGFWSGVVSFLLWWIGFLLVVSVPAQMEEASKANQKRIEENKVQVWYMRKPGFWASVFIILGFYLFIGLLASA
jgi:hypothetical protein